MGRREAGTPGGRLEPGLRRSSPGRDEEARRPRGGVPVVGLLFGLILVATGASGALPGSAQAQGAPELYGRGLKVDLNDDGSMYIRFITWHQIWIRAIQNNPGTVIDGSDDAWTGDVMLRRSRFLFYAQLTDWVLILTHFGINNQTFTNGGVLGDGFRPQLYFHDVWVEFKTFDDVLYLGGGLIYWNGISRMTSASTLNFMGLDAPILNWPTIERTDQFARQLGVYAKGEVDRLHYRISLTRPFIRDIGAFVSPGAGVDPSTGEGGGGPTEAAAFNAEANSFALRGYFTYQFLEQEGHKLPYFVGSYLGTKRVLNLGAGFHWQPNAVVSCSEQRDPGIDPPCDPGDRQVDDLVLVGADVFVDLPFGESALTGYLAYYYYDFGPDFERTFGIGNLATNGARFGNAYPNIGTGDHVYAQLGYMLPFRPWNQHKIVPYTTFQASMLEALDDPSLIVELGVKYYLIGHHASVTFNWRNRPVFLAQDPATESFVASPEAQDRANELIVQLMIYL